MYAGPPPPVQGLPPGWSQHLAPNGQPYYFNAVTGQSTHVHPFAQGSPQPQPAHAGPSSAAPAPSKPKKEKPKTKDPIPGAPGWIRVTTNMGNVFYTHPESRRSEWTVPDEIKDAVADMDKHDSSGATGDMADEVLVKKQQQARDDETQEDIEERQTAQNVADATSASDGKRKRQEAAEEQEMAGKSAIDGDDQADGIDAADLIGAPPGDDSDEKSDAEPEPDTKRQRLDGDQDQDENDEEQDDDDDDDEAWQRQMAAEMAAEAEAQETQQTSASPPAAAQPPSAPPQPPLPPSSSSPVPPAGGYTGPPPGFGQPPPPAAAAPPPPPTLSLEEGRALFMHMLTSLNGTKDEINPMAPWDKELPKFVHLSNYTSLSQLKDRQDAFNDWCRDRLREKRQMKNKATAASSSSSSSNAPTSSSSTSPSEAYRALLKAEVKSTRARFDDFRKDFKKDRRFYAFGRDDREREKHFKAYLRELGEEKRKAAQQAEQAFLAVLHDVVGSHKEGSWLSMSTEQLKDDVWRDVKKTGGLESRKEYDAVGSSSRRAELFVEWARGGVANGQSSIPSNSSKATDADSGADASARREKALREREEQVQRQRMDTDRKNRRALGAANREQGSIRFGELLVDAVRDPLMDWHTAVEELRSDPRFDPPGLNPAEKRSMFDEHIDKLTAKKRDQLQAIFAAHGPSLDVDEDVVLPLVKNDAEYERLDMKRFVCGIRDARESDALHDEFKRWKRERQDRARRDFEEMLKGELHRCEYPTRRICADRYSPPVLSCRKLIRGLLGSSTVRSLDTTQRRRRIN